MKYELVTATKDNITETVNSYIKNGWKPHGSAFVIETKKKKNDLYARFDYYQIIGQPMLKED